MHRVALLLALGIAACGSNKTMASADAGPAGDVTCSVFPADNAWNTPIDSAPLHPRSADYIATLGQDLNLHPDFGTTFEGEPLGIPYVVVGVSTPLVDIDFEETEESDPGPYPIPADAQVEAGSDRHVIAVDTDSCQLFELFNATADGDGSWSAFSGARFDLNSNELRTDGFTSADAAGLPIFAGLVRYDEVVEAGAVNHAIRMTARRTQQAFIHPATHAAGERDESAPPMGTRLRLVAEFDCSAFSSEIQILCAAFKTYGVIIADNGSSWFVSGAPDPRWDDGALRDIKSIPGSAFEAVDTGAAIPL